MGTAKRRGRIAVTTVLVMAAVACAVGFAARGGAQSPAQLLRQGERYLLEMDYEQALVAFAKLVEIEPMNPRSYTGAAEAYVGLGQPDIALEMLQTGYGRTGDEGIRDWIVAMGGEPSESGPLPAEQSAGTPEIREPSPEAVALFEQIYRAYLDDDVERCMELQLDPVILNLYEEVPGDEYGSRMLFYTHETQGRMRIELQDHGDFYQILYLMGMERDVATRVTVYHDLDAERQPTTAHWRIHTYADGKSTGPFESRRYDYQDGLCTLTEIETGDVLDGAYQGEVIMRRFHGGEEQEVIKSMYIDGYIQPAGPANEDGELPQAVSTYRGNHHAVSTWYIPADDREWSVRRPYEAIGLR